VTAKEGKDWDTYVKEQFKKGKPDISRKLTSSGNSLLGNVKKSHNSGRL
jgi:hypothetical protein